MESHILVKIGSDNGLASVKGQTIIWTDVDLLSIWISMNRIQ